MGVLTGYYYVFLFLFLLCVVFWLPLTNHGFAEIEAKYSPGTVVLLALVIIPLAEELMFRLWLRWNPWYVIVSVLLFETYFYRRLFRYSELVPCLILLLVMLLSVIILLRCKSKVRMIWNKYYRYLFYLTVFIFAALHFTNFTRSQEWIYLLMLTPYVLSAFMLAYVRIKYGILFAVLMHALMNSLSVLL